MPVKPPDNSEDIELDDESVDFAQGPAPVKELEPPQPFHSEAQVLFNSQSRLRGTNVAPAEDGPVSALEPANVSKDQPKLVPLRIEQEAKVATVKVVEDAPVSALEPVNVPARTNPEVQTATIKAKEEQPVSALDALNTVVEYSKSSVAAVLNTSGFAVLDPTTHAAVKATVPAAYDTAAKIVAPFTQTKEQPKADKPSTAKLADDGPVSALAPANVSKDVLKVTTTVLEAEPKTIQAKAAEDGPVSALEPVNVPVRANPEVKTATAKAAQEQPLSALDAMRAVVEHATPSVAAVVNTSGFAYLDPTTHAAVKATIPVAYDTATRIVAPFTQTKEQPKEAKPATAKVADDGPVSALEPANVTAGSKPEVKTTTAKAAQDGPVSALEPVNVRTGVQTEVKTVQEKASSLGPVSALDPVNLPPRTNVDTKTATTATAKSAQDGPTSALDPLNLPPRTNVETKIATAATAKASQDGPAFALEARGTTPYEQLKVPSAARGDTSNAPKTASAKTSDDMLSEKIANRAGNPGEQLKGSIEVRSQSDAGTRSTTAKGAGAGPFSASESAQRVSSEKSENSTAAGTKLAKEAAGTHTQGKDFNSVELFASKARGVVDGSSATNQMLRFGSADATAAKIAMSGLTGKTASPSIELAAILQGRAVLSTVTDALGRKNAPTDVSTNKGSGSPQEPARAKPLTLSPESSGTKGSAHPPADNGVGKGHGLPGGDGQPKRPGSQSQTAGDTPNTRTAAGGSFTVKAGPVNIAAEISATRINNNNSGNRAPAPAFDPATVKANPTAFIGDTRRPTTAIAMDSEHGAQIGQRSLIPTDATTVGARRSGQYGFVDHSGKRFLTGAELIILMSLGGISRVRHIESTAKRFNSPEERSHALKLYDRLLNILSTQRTGRTEGKFPSGDMRVVVKLENNGDAHRSNTRPSGSEIAVSALIALSNTARMREDVFLSQFSAGQTLPIERFIDVPQNQPRPNRQIIDTSAQVVRRMLNRVDMLPPKERPIVSPPANSDETSDDQTTFANIKSTSHESAQPPSLRRRHWLVSPGETLTGIGSQMFDDPAIGWLIADINAEKIMENWVGPKRVVEIQSRQSLNLPTPEEVHEFYRKLSKAVNPDNLVTIVAERQLDLELAQSDLKVLFGNSAPTCSSLPTFEIADESSIDES